MGSDVRLELHQVSALCSSEVSIFQGFLLYVCVSLWRSILGQAKCPHYCRWPHFRKHCSTMHMYMYITYTYTL